MWMWCWAAFCTHICSTNSSCMLRLVLWPCDVTVGAREYGLLVCRCAFFGRVVYAFLQFNTMHCTTITYLTSLAGGYRRITAATYTRSREERKMKPCVGYAFCWFSRSWVLRNAC
jgi:hypothetical protein